MMMKAPFLAIFIVEIVSGLHLVQKEEVKFEDIAGCAGEEGDRLQFCQASGGMGAHANMQYYLNLRENCKWSTEPLKQADNFDYLEYVTEGHYTNQNHTRPEELRPGTVKLQRCHLTDGEHTWSIDRFGPFHGKGDTNMHDFIYDSLWGIAPGNFVEEHKLTGCLASPVKEDGEILGYPPIHIHHTHIGPASSGELTRLTRNDRFMLLPFTQKVVQNKQLTWALTVDTHGDRQCRENQGGTDCLMFIMPPGYGTRIFGQQYVWGMFDDVSKTGTQRPFFIEYAGRFSPEIKKRIHWVGLAHIWPCAAPQMHSEDYWIPADQDSVIWSSWATQKPVRFLINFPHLHHAFAPDYWMITGSHESLGLVAPKFAREHPWDPWMPKSQNMTLDDVRETVKLHMVKNNHRELCRARHPDTRREPLAWFDKKTPHEDHKPGWYDRFTTMECKNWNLGENEPFTMITFHNPPSADTSVKKVSMEGIRGQHSVLYGWADGEEPPVFLPLDYMNTQENSPFCRESTS